MSTVDNNDTIKQNEKVFIEKKQQNDKQFVELCYKVLYATIEMHQNLIKYITQIKEQALDENNKRIYQEKEETHRQENMSSYNEAITKSLAKLLDKAPPDLTEKIKTLLESIFKRIAEIDKAIQKLDVQIAGAVDNIQNAKTELAQEMKNYFVTDNPAIAMRARSLSNTLPQLFDSKSVSDNDSVLHSLYLQFVNKFIDNLDQVQMSKALEEGRNYARKTITEYFESKGTITPEMEKEITILAHQYAMQLLRDMAKSPAMTSQVETICINERKIAALNISKQQQIQEKEHLSTKASKTEQFALSTSNTTIEHTTMASSIVKSLQDALNYKPLTATEAALYLFENTEEKINNLKEIRETAGTELKSEPGSNLTSAKLSESIDSIQKIVSEHQDTLATGFDFLNDDPVIASTRQQTIAPTLK